MVLYLHQNNPNGEKEIRINMKQKIESNPSFQVLSHSFSVSPSSQEYTLQYSADGINWTDYEEAIPADENLIVNDCAYGQFIKLDGYNPYNGEGDLIY